MEFVIDVINNLVYISQECFWLKETLVILQSFIIFALAWWLATLKDKYILLLLLSAFIGSTCSIISDLGFCNDNDVLKHIAPASLYLIGTNDKGRRDDILLFAFLLPFCLISYEPNGILIAASSILSHCLIYSFIVIAGQSIGKSVFISIIIGLLYNYIDKSAPPGTNDMLANPVLITLYTKGIDYYRGSDKHTLFLKYFWVVLLCFAYFGNWIFYFVSDYYDYFDIFSF